MSPIPEVNGQGGDVAKKYSCFICSAESDDRGIPLTTCETSHSRIRLGEKIQEVVGRQFVLLISNKDSICWNCAEDLNWIDRIEHELDIAKEGICQLVRAKYKNSKLDLSLEESLEFNGGLDLSPSPISVVDSTQDPPYDPSPDELRRSRKVKKFSCTVCMKKFLTLGALGVHKSRVHGSTYTCNECDLVFSTEFKYKTHLVKHTAASLKHVTNKTLSCVSCGFKTNNTEVYCRHVCRSSIVSLNCVLCRKRFVADAVSKKKKIYKCPECEKGEAEGQVDFFVPTDDLGVNGSENLEFPEIEAQNEPFDTGLSSEFNPDTPDITDSNDLSLPGETVISTDLHTEMPEFFRDPQIKDQPAVIGDTIRIINPDGLIEVTYLKCSSCGEEFEMGQLATHPCFINGEVIEYSQVERTFPVEIPFYVNDGEPFQAQFISENGDLASLPSDIIISPSPAKPKRRIPKIPAQENTRTLPDSSTKLTCKTCDAEFRNCELMRQHWDLTGHSREIESAKIKDVINATEQTFKVVKQNFNIRAQAMSVEQPEVKRKPDDYLNSLSSIKMKEFGETQPETNFDHPGESDESLKCVTCGVTFYNEQLLRMHYSCTGHGALKVAEIPVVRNEILSCGYCSRPFQSKFRLQRHLQGHYKGTNKGSCRYCFLEFEDKSLIRQHALEAHGADIYQCKYCDRTFLNRHILDKHEMKHTVNACDDCKLKFPSKRLLLTHKDQIHRPSACRICGKIIPDVYSLKRHERRHYYQKLLKCGLCDKTFRTKSSLRLHTNVHARDPQHLCYVCGLGFKDLSALDEHKICHVKTQQACPKCSLLCPSRMFFWMHMKLHSVSHACTVCGRCFRDTSLLAVHRRSHLRVRPYQCPHCPRIFSVPATLRRHLTVHMKVYPYKCSICKKGFLSRQSYHSHLEARHPIRQHKAVRLPSLSLNSTDEDLFQAADTLISDDSIMFSDYTKQMGAQPVPQNEVVVENPVLFDALFE